MNGITRTGWMFWRFWLFLAALVPAVQLSAESQSNLTCEVEEQPDGSFRYQLSKPPGSTGCKTDWEDKNRTVVATGFIYDETLVQNLTRQFIVLRECRGYLYYRQDCFGDFQEAHCRVNCSRLSDTTPPKNTVPTLICVSGSWCLDQRTFGLSIAGILVLAACPCGICYIRKHFKRRRARTAIIRTSYTRADEEVVVELNKQVIM